MTNIPNILLISCHDIGQHLECYGIDTIQTPAIDRLAAQGVCFTNSFCTAPQCSPSRASIYTGRYPHCNGVMGLTHGSFQWDLHEDEKHLAGLLRDIGYQTALIGVQHETRIPEKMGFDAIQLLHRPCSEVAQASLEYLQNVSMNTKPFYLQIGFFEPHRPFDFGHAKPDQSRGVTIPPYLVDEPSAHEEFAAFQGSIAKVDRAIGTILERLDKLNLTDNTITIFTADHGIPFPRAKCSLYDPGLEVPLIIRWPDQGWTGGRVFSQMISNVDYLPTLLEAAGGQVPDNIQGQSFLPLFEGKVSDERTEIFGEMTYHDYYDPRRCIRTQRYKLIANFSTAPFFMNPSQSWRPKTITVEPNRPTYAYHPELELYDLETDPLEFKNLAEDATHSQICNDLRQRLYNWMRETKDPLLQGVPLSPHHQRTMSKLKS